MRELANSRASIIKIYVYYFIKKENVASSMDLQNYMKYGI